MITKMRAGRLVRRESSLDGLLRYAVVTNRVPCPGRVTPTAAR
jgi:hypothetical protein